MIALVPGVRAFLPRYASLEDPVGELRAACLRAVEVLGPRVRVVASGTGAAEVAAAVVAACGGEVVDAGETGVLVVGNGSAKRSEKAPGHLDPRSEEFDEHLGAALRGDLSALESLDLALAEELWADVRCMRELPRLAAGAATVLYEGDPFGVQYWVILWPGN